MKTIGVLGGMGPESTALFFQRIIQLTPAQKDQDHIPVIIYSDPQIPDRSKAILEHGPSPLLALVKGIEMLEKAGSDFICIPCNTVHYYFKRMESASHVPLINLIEEMVNVTLNEYDNVKNVGLLATIGTVKTKIYQKAFQKENIKVVVPDDWELNDLHSAILRLKGQSQNSYSILKFAENLIKKEIQVLLLGCTELSLIRSHLSLKVPIIDSVDVLAKKAVNLALNL
ncbi:MAG: aspartate/glutamate racemase family protein [bacterium]